MLNYHHLRYFWLVAHEGNLTRAAKKCHIAQSALSMQIDALEVYFGQPLFERTGRTLVLTEAGHVALDYADAIFAAGEELQGTMDALNMPAQRVLRVGALATLSRNFQITFLQPLLSTDEHRVSICSGGLDVLIQQLEHYALDVVLTDVVPPLQHHERVTVHTIAQQSVSVIGHPEQCHTVADIDMLLRTESLVVPARPSSIRADFDAYVERLGIVPRIVAEVDDMAMLRLVARAHRGLAILPPIVVKDELENGVLVEVAQLPGLQETFYALTVPRRYAHPMIAVLLGG
jgi:LysR family transcriptional activator of nhaA